MKDYLIRFSSGEEMLKRLDVSDLFSPTIEKYVFSYNESGAVAHYAIRWEEAIDLAKKSLEQDEYWSAFLGAGGFICDDPIDYCNSVYNEVWINTKDVLDYYKSENKTCI